MTADPKGYYAILNLTPGEDMKKVKSAYSKLIAKWHPDNGSEAYEAAKLPEEEKQKRMEEIKKKCTLLNEARSVLLDEKQKEEYDNPNMGINPFDLFNMRKRNTEPVISIEITFEESFLGGEKTFDIKRSVQCTDCELTKCSVCKGMGKVVTQSKMGMFVSIQERECNRCNNGYISNKKCSVCKNGVKIVNSKLKMEIPRFVKNGEVYKIENEWEDKEKKPYLMIEINVKDSEKFVRIGNNMACVLEINLANVILGKNVVFEYVNKKNVEVKLPKMKEISEFIKIKGKGFNNGSLFLKLKYLIDEKWTEDSKLKDLVKENKKKIDEIWNGEFVNEIPEEERQRSSFFDFGFF